MSSFFFRGNNYMKIRFFEQQHDSTIITIPVFLS